MARIKFFNEFINENKNNLYQVYHNTYTSAVNTALDYAQKLGYDYNPEDTAQEIGLGPKKPSAGKTNRITIPLTKGGKPSKKALHIQIYGMGGHYDKYELNTYVQ